jgi:large subunit ribosomal protein L15
MFLHELKSPRGSRKRKVIIGRGPGSGCGKTSGRGANGLGARQGSHFMRGYEGGQIRLLRRLPKFGFNSAHPVTYQLVKTSDLNRFKKDTLVTAELLKKVGLIKRLSSPYKILDNGEVKLSLVIKAHGFSKAAKEKIEKAGGKTEIVAFKVEKDQVAAKEK